ncbi:hypothetical protein TNCT_647871 [Trichonephila clavata]|uniref:Uncharacterized protein n=1 Tax=Trichonephila clavata TaxID=2740835 RepID=A0A8X6HJF2_TRICU|nr:hypothetical protein TNCT_647871 [Trichonephila clavata]
MVSQIGRYLRRQGSNVQLDLSIPDLELQFMIFQTSPLRNPRKPPGMELSDKQGRKVFQGDFLVENYNFNIKVHLVISRIVTELENLECRWRSIVKCIKTYRMSNMFRKLSEV